jgi:TFIIF-interacting CTD phosphatase-like protein
MRTSLTNKTLVLDLDECLVRTHTGEDVERFDVMAPSNVGVRHRFFEISFGDEFDPIWGVRRPYLDQFLAFAGTYFERIVVWSAGEKQYVVQVVKELFRDHRQPDLILTRGDCMGDTTDYHKPLSLLKKRMPDLDLRLVIAIDDRRDNFRDNPDNGIVIPRFDPTVVNSFVHQDHHLAHIINWLMSPSVLASQDFTSLDKKRIFTSRKPSLKEHERHTRYPHLFYFSPMSTYI